ncbi:hypothetical protein ACFL6U_09175 [Planctomycetota bacterium]
MASKDTISLNRLAYELNLPFGWLKREAEAGRIPSLRIGRRRLFNLDAVTTTLSERAAQTRKTTILRRGVR